MCEIESQKNRMEDALERRFAEAKAELEKHQNRNNKRPRAQNTNSNSTNNSAPKKEKIVKSLPSVNKFHKKEVEDVGPEYAGLTHTVDENLLKTNVKFSERKGRVVDGFMHEILQKGDAAQKFIHSSRSMKVDNWILLDNYVQPQKLSLIIKEKDVEKDSKRFKKRMSMKKLKMCGCLDIPKEMRYEYIVPMHELWKKYMKQLLRSVGNAHLAQHILDADLHGAIIIVASCKMSVLNGVTGILIRETAQTFGIVTADDKFRVVPKKLSVFIFQVEGWKIALFGDKLLNRNANSNS